MNSWILRIGIIVLIVAGGFLLRDRLSSNAGDLKVGDCFDDPAGQSPRSRTSSTIRAPRPTRPRSSSSASSPATTRATRPTPPIEYAGSGRTACRPGRPTRARRFETEPMLTAGYYQPTPDGWSSGDRDVICYAYREDNAPMTVSVKKP